eukprot:jgi/Picsp_1/575/NSC_00572-R1_---NA---
MLEDVLRIPGAILEHLVPVTDWDCALGILSLYSLGFISKDDMMDHFESNVPKKHTKWTYLSISDCNKPELLHACDVLGFKRYSTLRKDELVEKLKPYPLDMVPIEVVRCILRHNDQKKRLNMVEQATGCEASDLIPEEQVEATLQGSHGTVYEVNKRNIINALLQKPNRRCTQTQVKELLCLSDKDLVGLDVVLAPNPHYRSAAPMKLYLLRGAVACAVGKYNGWHRIEKEREKRFNRRQARADKKRKRAMEAGCIVGSRGRMEGYLSRVWDR